MPESKLTFLCVFMVLAHLSLYAQDSPSEALENLVETIMPNQYDDDVNVEQVYEDLIQYYQEPLNLNAANADDLRKFVFLSERQINNIIRYKAHYGDLLSEYEIAMIPSMDTESIQLLLPFIVIQPQKDRRLALKKRIQEAENKYLIFRQSRILEPQKAYLHYDTIQNTEGTSYYQGSPHQLYTRVRISQPGSISLGITMEKDAGESIAWDKAYRKYGADFNSAHFQIEKAGPVEQFLIGDYSFQSGQQLVFGSGLGLGKGDLTVRSVGRSPHGIRPYTSSTESGFMRGIATSWNIPVMKQKIKLTLLYSRAPRHAKVFLDELSTYHSFRGFDWSGLHRNTSELLDRKQVQEQSIGGNIHYTNKYQNLQIGINLLQTHFSLPMIPAEALYKKYDFRGDSHKIGSTYFSYQYQHWHTFAELAITNTHQYGILAGVNAAMNSYLESVWLYRKYSPGFFSIYGNAFGESSRNANEEGLYWGLKVEPLPRLTLSAYYDLFRFPWLRYRVDAPSRGHEYLLRASYSLKSTTHLSLQFRLENKGINLTNDSLAFRIVSEGIRKNIVLNIAHSLNEKVSIKTKIHSSNYTLGDSLTQGWVVAQDISYSLGRWKADGRLALINTDDYNNRQYLYENDVLYAFSVPAYSGMGMKYYLLLRCKINRKMSSWVRWGRMIYDDRDVIGSGMDEIAANHRTQVKVQWMYKF